MARWHNFGQNYLCNKANFAITCFALNRQILHKLNGKWIGVWTSFAIKCIWQLTGLWWSWINCTSNYFLEVGASCFFLFYLVMYLYYMYVSTSKAKFYTVWFFTPLTQVREVWANMFKPCHIFICLSHAKNLKNSGCHFYV